MNHRQPILCSTCNQGIVLRIGLGTQFIQNISIQCPKCKQKISLVLKYNRQQKMLEDIENLINCIFTEEEDDFIAVNLHTELIYPKEYINEKKIMPAMFVTESLMKHAEEKGFFNFDKATDESGLFGKKSIYVFDGIGGDSNLLEDWFVIEKSYSLYNSNMIDLMNEELKKYTRINDIYKFTSMIHSVLYDFLYRFISPNFLLYNEIKKNFSKSKSKHKYEFKKFKNYYNSELQSIYWKNYIDIFSEYFKHFSEFNRLLLNTKIELHPDIGTESIFCPTNFNDVKMFYGNAYEYLTTHLTTFACINNINKNRKYDTFESMTLKKYNELNKDSKFNPLLNDVSFQLFCNEISSTLRNASHHKWFYIDDDKPGYLQFRSGGTGQLNAISYIDYIYKSNQLMMKLAIMAMVEIKFLYKQT